MQPRVVGSSTGVVLGPAEQTFAAHACTRLDALCAAASFSCDERARACSQLSEILEPWGRDLVGVRPRQPSDISDDGFPLEFSLTLTRGEPEVRVLFEAQATSEGPEARWAAAQTSVETLGLGPEKVAQSGD